MTAYSRGVIELENYKRSAKLFAVARNALGQVSVLFSLLFGLLSLDAVSGTSENPAAIPASADNCLPFENSLPLCLFTNPEDLAVLPDHKVLIVSEYGDSHGTRPGALVFFDIAKQQRRLAFKGGDAALRDSAAVPNEYWGDSACTQPPGKSFSPHGIDLSLRPDGRWQLLVVQHGGRESIEFFEVKGLQDAAQLIWRGCAIAPKTAMLNSVAAGGKEDFFTTRMSYTTADSREDREANSTAPAGTVYRWTKASGFQSVAGTDGVMPNGIAATADGSVIYVIYSGESLIKKIDVNSGTVLASAALLPGDNVKWSADGKTLLAASFIGSESSEQFFSCMTPGIEICPIAFAIVELDPDTLSRSTLFENPDAPMGAGTVGMKVGSMLFIGSFSSNRLLQVDLNAEQRETVNE